MIRKSALIRRSVVAFVATMAVIGGYATPYAAAGPVEDAQAADALRAALSGTGGVTSFVDGLATVGAFADPAPGLTLIPGAANALGVADLLDESLAAFPSFGTATSPAAMASALNGQSADITSDPGTPAHPLAKRHVTWQATSSVDGAVSKLALTLTATRTVPSGIRASTTDKPFDF
ncbi:MAG: hypothetical protein QOJ03_578, partial [Frankiaceae bacterium]|nr:hypothetical protein [Frankiaceae bacterium]